jgi:hypothetical protein
MALFALIILLPVKNKDPKEASHGQQKEARSNDKPVIKVPYVEYHCIQKKRKSSKEDHHQAYQASGPAKTLNDTSKDHSVYFLMFSQM